MSTGAANHGEARERVLAERARALARPLEEATSAESEFVTFRLGRGTYALPARDVLGIVRLQRIVPLPGATAPIAGLTSFRGSLLTLLDVRNAVGASSATAEMLVAIVLESEGTPVGILAESADLARLPSDALHPPARDGVAHPALLVGVTSEATMVLDSSALARLHK